MRLFASLLVPFGICVHVIVFFFVFIYYYYTFCLCVGNHFNTLATFYTLNSFCVCLLFWKGFELGFGFGPVVKYFLNNTFVCVCADIWGWHVWQSTYSTPTYVTWLRSLCVSCACALVCCCSVWFRLMYWLLKYICAFRYVLAYSGTLTFIYVFAFTFT